MRLPERIGVVWGVAGGLCAFLLLRWFVVVLGGAMGLGLSGSHVLLKLLLGGLVLVVAGMRKGGLGEMGWGRPRGWVWGVVVIGCGFLGVCASVGLLGFEGGGVPLMQGLSFLEIVVTVWLLSTVVEELFCRGLMQGWMGGGEKDGGVWLNGGVVGGAVLFGGMHLTLLMDGADGVTVGVILVATTILGWLCGGLRRMSESLWPAVLGHFAFNVGGVVGAVAFMLVMRGGGAG